MANVKLKRSSVQGKVPATTDLAVGELGLNTYDGKAYLRGFDTADFVREMAVKDAVGNLFANSFADAITSFSSAGGTTTLTVNSTGVTIITGTTTQTVKLPDATTLKVGRNFRIFNRSTDVVTVVNSASTTLATLQPGASNSYRLTDNTTATGAWDVDYGGASGTSSSTGIDYLSLNSISADGETNAQGWSAFNTTFTNNVPGAITAGSTLVNVTRDTTKPLRGKGSLQFNCTTATGSTGHGIITNAFTVSNADLAKMLTAAFDYLFISGQTAVDTSGSSTQTIEIWIYNVNLNQWTQPAGFRGIISKYVSGQVKASFQTDSSSSNNSYRLAFIIKNAPTAAFSLNFEGTVGPQTNSYTAPAMSDWTSYPVVITASNGTNPTIASQQGWYRRIGDTIECIIQTGAISANGNGIYLFPIPSGLSIDLTKTTGGAVLVDTDAGSNTLYTPVGAATLSSGTWSEPFKTGVFVVNSTSVALVANSATADRSNAWGSIDNLTGVSATFALKFAVPIVGWSAGVTNFNDADGRICVLDAHGVSTTSYPTTATVVPFNSVTKDTHGSYNTNGTYTFASSGAFFVLYQLDVNSNLNASGGYVVGQALLNGTTVLNKGYVRNQSTAAIGSTSPLIVPVLHFFNAGDTIQLQTTAAQAFNTTNDPLVNFVQIFKISGNLVAQASESVAATYNTSAGITFPASGTTYSNLAFPTKEDDSHNAWSQTSNNYTFPSPGRYVISCNLGVNSSNSGTTTADVFIIVSNKQTSWFRQNTSLVSTIFSVGGEREYKVNAGDTLAINIRAYYSGSAPTLFTDPGMNFISIVKVGN